MDELRSLGRWVGMMSRAWPGVGEGNPESELQPRKSPDVGVGGAHPSRARRVGSQSWGGAKVSQPPPGNPVPWRNRSPLFCEAHRHGHTRMLLYEVPSDPFTGLVKIAEVMGGVVSWPFFAALRYRLNACSGSEGQTPPPYPGRLLRRTEPPRRLFGQLLPKL